MNKEDEILFDRFIKGMDFDEKRAEELKCFIIDFEQFQAQKRGCCDEY